MRIISILATFALVVFSSSLTLAEQPLDGSLISALKRGHHQSCRQSVDIQLQSIGAATEESRIALYCECLGSLYFNDFSTTDYHELTNTGALPLRLQYKQRALQEYCAALHL